LVSYFASQMSVLFLWNSPRPLPSTTCTLFTTIVQFLVLHYRLKAVLFIRLIHSVVVCFYGLVTLAYSALELFLRIEFLFLPKQMRS
jgi:intracellular septation protein A